ncbi:MAG: MFS transporter [Acidobacteriota bacterium]
MNIHKSILRLSAGHFLIDAYASMLGAFLPFLQDKLNLSFSQAGILGGTLVFSSSLMQPLYGYLADRLRHKAFAALGPAVAGVFICSMGMAPSFSSLLLLVILGGVGIASFHPQGAAVTAQVGTRRHGYSMAVFITGGMVGYSIGPVYITSVITLAGLENSYWAAVPGVLMSAYLLVYGPSLQKVEEQVRPIRLRERLMEKRRLLLIHYSLVVVRSINHLVFVAFLPLYLTMRGHSKMEGALSLTLFLLAGAISGLWGGILVDRLGGKLVIAVSLIGYVPFALGFLLTTGPLSIVLCTLAGAFLLFSNPVNVVMAQRLIPEFASTVSALMMGFAWGVGGFIIVLVGFLSDIFGLQTILLGVILLCSPGVLPAFLLPSESET